MDIREPTYILQCSFQFRILIHNSLDLTPHRTRNQFALMSFNEGMDVVVQVTK